MTDNKQMTEKELQAEQIKSLVAGAPAKKKGISGHVRDLGLTALSGAVSVPELAVGLADIPTGGRVGKFLENEDGAFGFRPRETKEAIAGWKTERAQEQLQEFTDTEGLGGKVGYALKNPSLIANTVVESLPSMLAGGVASRGIGLAAKGLSPVAAGALGEGTVGMGLAAESIRQQTDDGMLTPKQAGLAAATGATTAGFGFAGGKLAQKLGIGDVDTIIAGGGRTANPAANIAGSAAANASKDKGILRRGAEGVLSEGLLEELPQSVSETILQNEALGTQGEGVADAAALGLLSGGLMGTGAGAFARNRRPDERITPTEDMGQESSNYGGSNNPKDPNFNPAGLLENKSAPQLGFQGRESNQFNAGPNGEVFTGDQYNEYLAGQQERARNERDAGQQPRSFDDVTQAPQGYNQFGNDPRLPAPNDFTVTPDGTVQTGSDVNTTLQNEQQARIEERARRARGEILDRIRQPGDNGFGDFDSGVSDESKQSGALLGLPAPDGTDFTASQDGQVYGRDDINTRLSQERDAAAERRARIARGEILDRTPIPEAPKPSELMGLDPNKGGLSAAAVIAVDSGASDVGNQVRESLNQERAISVWQSGMMDRLEGADQNNSIYARLAQAMQNEPVSVSEKTRLMREADALPRAEVAAKQIKPNTRVLDEARAQTKAYTPEGKEVKAQWDVVDASDLVTSNTDSFTINPDFPSSRQPRDRTRASAQQQVNEIASKLQPNLLGESPDVSTGAPFVGANDNVVDSGNGRSMAIRRVYQEGGEKAGEYRQFVNEQAAKFGLDTDAVNMMQSPVLVRRNTSDMNRDEFARAANKPTAARMSSTEQAASDAKSLPDASLLSFNGDGNMSLYQSQSYLKNFIAALPKTEQGSLMDDKGTLSREGKNRIEAAIVQDAYNNPKLVSAISEKLDNDTTNVLRAVTDKAPQISQINADIKTGDVYDNTLARDIADATQAYMDIKNSEQDVDDYLSQDSLFDDGLTDGTKEILGVLSDNRRSAKAIGEYIQSRINEVTGRGNPKQGGLSFDDDIETDAPNVLSDAPAPKQSPNSPQAATQLTNENPMVNIPEPTKSKGAGNTQDVVTQSNAATNEIVPVEGWQNSRADAANLIRQLYSAGYLPQSDLAIIARRGDTKQLTDIANKGLNNQRENSKQQGKVVSPESKATAIARAEKAISAATEKSKGRLDHGELSIPNRTKNINKELDKYNAAKEKQDKREREDRRFLANERELARKPARERAEELYKEHGKLLRALIKDKVYGTGNTPAEFLKNEIVVNPENFIKMVEQAVSNEAAKTATPPTPKQAKSTARREQSNGMAAKLKAATQAPTEVAPETKKSAEVGESNNNPAPTGDWQAQVNGNEFRINEDGITVRKHDRVVHIRGANSITANKKAKELANQDIRELHYIAAKDDANDPFSEGSIWLDGNGDMVRKKGTKKPTGSLLPILKQAEAETKKAPRELSDRAMVREMQKPTINNGDVDYKAKLNLSEGQNIGRIIMSSGRVFNDVVVKSMGDKSVTVEATVDGKRGTHKSLNYETLDTGINNEKNYVKQQAAKKQADKSAGNPKFSRAATQEQSKTNKGSTNTTRQQVIDKLNNKFGKAVIDKLIADGKLDIKVLSDFVVNGKLTIPSDVDGLYHNGKATLIADNLSDDMIIPTFLHELGGHGGLQTLMDKKAYAALMRDFDALVKAGDPLAMQAKAMADSVARNEQDALDEYLPYLITLTSRQQAKQGKVAGMINRIAMAIRSWLRNTLGMPVKMNAQDVLALAERMVEAHTQPPLNNIQSPINSFDGVNAPQEEIAAVRKDKAKTLREAPNGKPSNLNEQQWLQVRTPAFKQWFGDWENDPANASEILDENGEPLVLYHGAKSDFWVFDMSRSASQRNAGLMGMFFTDNAKTAAGYTVDLPKEAAVVKANENLVKITNEFGAKRRQLEAENKTGDEIQELTKKEFEAMKAAEVEFKATIADAFNNAYDNAEGRTKAVFVKSQMPFEQDADGKSFLAANKKAAERYFIDGIYDGIVNNNVLDDANANHSVGAAKVVISFDPTNIKSATDNTGTFDNSNPDIRFSNPNTPDKQMQDVRDKYEGTDEWMKAPNGEDTNLTEQQWLQVRTPAFKQWFGDWEGDAENASEVVDDNGEPMVVYHSTSEIFNDFNRSKLGGNAYSNANKVHYAATAGVGFWFSNEDLSKRKRGGMGSESIASFLNIRNSYELESLEDLASDIESDVIPEDADLSSYFEDVSKIRDAANEYKNLLVDGGLDGVIIENDEEFDDSTSFVVFEPNQIKSATGNAGTFDSNNNDIRFSRAAGMNDEFDPRNIAKETATRLYDWASSAPPGKLSWWHKTIGTMYNLAQRNPYFKPVFENTEKFINDVSFYAAKASELAPRLLPQLDSLRDITKSAIGAKDNEALSKPIFEGTLLWGRDLDGKAVLIEDWRKKVMATSKQDRLQMLKDANRITPAQLQELAKMNNIQANRFINGIIDEEVNAGLVWTDSELRSKFDLSDEQIELYREFRSATDKSLDSLTRSDMLRKLGKDANDIETAVMEAGTLDDAISVIEQHINSLSTAEPRKAQALAGTFADIKASAGRTKGLMDDGYAPLSRFGQYTVDVVDADGNREYFGMFESAYEARKMKAEMDALYGNDNNYTVSRGTLSNEEFKLFAGVTPETAELFGEMLGLDATGDKAADEAFQEYLKRTKNNRSAMKRLMHRKGIKGYSEDVGRVLASFIYSNARHTSAALNMGNIDRAITDIPKGEGQLKDAAVKLAEYIKNPQEEAQLMRGWMFAQYLGGSIASAVVNLTQPIAVSFPYLSQFGGAVKAASQLNKASGDWMKAFTDKSRSHFEPDLLAAIEKAEADGTLSPQEVHNLLKQASGKNPLSAGDGTKVGDARALAGNTLSRVSLAWGALFSGAEQINRRVTFVAAYRLAKEQGMANPEEFATKSIKETQFVYNKASRMNWGRGAVGGTLMTFKTYTVSYIELMHRLWNQGEKGSPERAQGRKATMIMLGVMFMLSGSGGLPFMEDAEDLIDGIGQIMGYNFSTKKSRQDFLDAWFGEMLGDFLESGASTLPGSPTDVSGRLGLGNLIPGTGILKERTNNTRDVLEIAGPAGDFAGRIATGTRDIAKGVANLDATSLKKGALEFAPTAVRNAVKGVDMASSGIYKDTKGYKVTDVSPVDAAFKFAGFQPLKVSKIQEANYLGQTATSFYSLRASNIRALWAAGVVEGNSSKVADAKAAVKDWNEKNPDQKIVIKPTDIARRVREMKMDKSERVTKLAPKSMREQMAQDFSQVRDGF